MTKEIISVNEAKNRMTLVLNGFYSFDEVKATGEKILEEAKKLKPGFGLINDIREFKPTSPEGGEEIKKIQMGVLKLGVKTIVRVVGDAALANMQLSRQSKEAGYDAVVVGSLEEAEEYLDNNL